MDAENTGDCEKSRVLQEQYHPLLRSITRYVTRYRSAYESSGPNQSNSSCDIFMSSSTSIFSGRLLSLILLNCLCRYGGHLLGDPVFRMYVVYCEEIDR
jgi:hypothetical protein